MKKFLSLFLILGMSSVVVNTSYSYSVDVDNGDPYEVPMIYTYTTTGNTMSGMLITVTGNTGTTTTANWFNNQGAVYKDSGGNTIWSLTVDNYALSTHDTDFAAGALWTFDIHDSQTTFTVAKIDIDATFGGTVFDIIPYGGGDDGVASEWYITPGSAFGAIMELQGTPPDFAAIYKNPIYLPNKYPLLDLYGLLSIDFIFNNGGTYFGSNDTLSFYTDTDNFRPIPEPATVMLFGLGLIGMAVIRRNKK